MASAKTQKKPTSRSKPPIPKEGQAAPEPGQEASNGSGPTSKDQKRPSIGDMIGKPYAGGQTSLAAAVLQITRDDQNWLATGILTDREIASSKRMMAKQMTRTGRLNLEQLVFQAGHLARSRGGYSLEMYQNIATAEMRTFRGFDSFYNRFNPNQQQGPAGPQPGQ